MDIPNDPVDVLRAVLDLERPGAQTGEEIFVGRSHPMPSGRVFGGQVVAQCVVAATATVGPDRAPHSLHGYFLRPGDVDEPITLAVERIHDGRSFARRRVQAYQRGEPIFSAIASFQDHDPGMEHQMPMPEVPAPEEVASAEEELGGAFALLRHSPIEARHVHGGIYLEVPDARATQATWLRIRSRLDDDPALHRAALAYMSDFTIQEPTLRANGVSWRTKGLRSASLDHAIWWHRDARADEWLLYVAESPTSRGGRGMNTGRIYTRGGELVASVAQEIMARTPAFN
ncbi:acyl-CoA thioesterase [Microbacterium sp. ZXX196]|uniref:acyl-CoA thioesterase n=1 Tax=Microbacterium sp. ZXX196 TaxID=2609291 RepID=UPI0034D2CE5D